ncbi:MAG: paraquat-inducible protein A [Planctomycetaceae bacterium]
MQTVPDLPELQVARCPRCLAVVARPGPPKSNAACAALALAALTLYPLGISLPVLRVERFGHVQEASIWAGTMGLFAKGQLFVGLIVLVCSIVIPIAKLLGMFLLVTRAPFFERRHRAWLHKVIEAMGRWGMVDVLLVAILAASLKLGDLMQVAPGPGAAAFAACVVLSILATALFRPHSIWEEGA